MNQPRNFEGRLIDLSFRAKRSEVPESRLRGSDIKTIRDF